MCIIIDDIYCRLNSPVYKAIYFIQKCIVFKSKVSTRGFMLLI